MTGRAFPWSDLSVDRRNALLLYAGLALVVGFALALVGFGYYRDRIAPRHAVVLTVGERKFDYSALERRVAYDLQRSFTEGTNLGQLIGESLRNMEREELLRRAASERGIAPSEEQITLRIKSKPGFPSDAPQDVFAALYRQDVLRSGLKVSEYRDILAASIIQDQLEAEAEATVPQSAEQAQVRLIQVATAAQAQDVKKRLDEGADIRFVAAEVSIHSSKGSAGDIGWVPPGVLSRKVEEIVFSLPIGGISDVIEAPDGFFIVQTRAKEERPVDNLQRRQVVARSVDNIISEQRDKLTSKVNLTPEQVSRLGKSLASRPVSGG